MAGYQAVIDVIVNGQSRVDRIIRQTDQLNDLIRSLARNPINLRLGDADRNIQGLAARLRESQREVGRFSESLNPLRQNFNRLSADVSRYQNAVRLGDRALERSGRVVAAYRNRINSAQGLSARLFERYERARNNYAVYLRANQLNTERLATSTRALERQQALLEARERSLAGLRRESERRGQELGSARAIREQISFVDQLANSYLRLSDAQERARSGLRGAPAFITGQVQGVGARDQRRDIPRQSTASIKTEIALFNDLANSVEVNSQAFRKFTIASKAASQSLDDVARRRVQILAEAFSGTGEARRGSTYGRNLAAEDVSRTRAEVENLLRAAQAAPRSEAGLSLLIEQLRDLRSLIPFVDSNYERLTRTINSLSAELQIGPGVAAESIRRRAFPSTPLDGPEEQAERNRFDKILTAQLDKQDRIEKSIAASKLTQAQKSELISEINLANRLLVENELDAAKDIAKFTEEKISAYKIINNQQALSVKLLEKVGNAEAQIARFETVGSGRRDLSFLDDFNDGLAQTEKAWRQLNDSSVKAGKAFDKQFERMGKIQQLYASGEFGPQPLGGSSGVTGGGLGATTSPLDGPTRLANQLNSALILQESLNALELSGVDTAAQKLQVQNLVNSMLSKEQEISSKLLADNDIELTQVRSFLQFQGKLLANSRLSAALKQSELDTATEFKTQLNNLNTLAARYSEERKNGVKIAAEEADLQTILNRLNSGQVAATKNNVNELRNSIKYYRSILTLRSAEARAAGAYVGGSSGASKTPEKLELQRNRILENANKTLGSIFDLEKKGVDVTADKIILEQQILDLKNSQNKSTQKGLELAAINIQSVKASVAGLAAELKEIGKGSGFDAAFQKLQLALRESSGYFGNTSPTQAIDQIVRTFKGSENVKGGQGKNLAQTLAAEAKSSSSVARAAGESLGEAVEEGLNDGLGIASPSKVAEAAMRNVIRTAISVGESGVAAIQALYRDLFAPDLGAIQRAPLAALGGSGKGDIAEKIAAFVGRTSAKPSIYRRLAGLSGEGILSSPAVTEATYRKAYEAGGIIPPIYSPASARRGLRGVSGLPGSGLEKAIYESAVKGVSLTGAFTGPLASSVSRSVGFFNPGSSFLSAFTSSGSGVGRGASLPLFGAQSTGSVQGSRGSFAFGRSPVSGGASSRLAAPYASFLALSRDAEKYKTTLPAALEGIVQAKEAFADKLIATGEKIGKIGDRLIVEGAARQRGEALATPAELAGEIGSLVPSVIRKGVQSAVASTQKLLAGEDFDSNFDFSSPAAMQRAGIRLGAQGGRNSIGAFSPFPSEGAIDAKLSSSERLLDAALGGLEGLFDTIKKSADALRSRFGGGGGGIIPPGGRGPAGGAGGDGDDLIRRAATAALGGPEELLGLKELRDLTKISGRDLGLLAGILEEVQQNLKPTAQGFDRINNELLEFRANVKRRQQQVDPDADFLTRRFGPRSANAISEGLIGGAFPLLFGQGAGASVGGGLGGAVGGFAGGGLGFGLSLVGTALGTFFDESTAKAIALGAALNDVSTVFDVVKEKSLFSSKEIEKLATKIQESGDTALASEIAQREIIRQIGTEGAAELSELSTQSDRLARAMALVSLRFQDFIAGPLAAILKGVGDAVERGAVLPAVERLYQQTTNPETRKQFSSRVRNLAIQNIDSSSLAQFNKDIAKKALFKDSPDQFADALNRLTGEQLLSVLDEFELPVKLKVDPGQLKDSIISVYNNQIGAIEGQLQAIDIAKGIANQARNQQREQEDIYRQRFELERSYAESIGNIRLNVENRVQQQALDNIRAQNELYEVQGQIRLQQLQNSNLELVSAQGANEYGQRLFQILGEAAAIELSAQQQEENRRRKFELEIQSTALQTETFKADIAKQVAKLNESTAKSVADINRRVIQSNEDYDGRRFELERKIAAIKLLVAEEEVRSNKTATKINIAGLESIVSRTPEQDLRLGKNREVLTALEEQERAIQKAGAGVLAAKPPAKLSGVSGIATSGVSFAEFDAAISRAETLSRALLEANGQLAALAKAGDWQEIKKQLLDLADQGYAAASNKLQDVIEAAENGGDALAGAGARIAASQNEIRKAIDALGQNQPGNKIVDEYRKGGLSDSQIRALLELSLLTTSLSEAQLNASRTANFYADSISSLESEIQSLTEEIKDATTFGNNYEKALRSLAERGLSPASKQAERLLNSARQLDILEDKAEVIRNIQTASEGLSGSMRGLIENFYELGSASEALKAFNEEISKKALGLVLDIAFKPVEENIRKSLIMFGEKIGFDFSTPAEKQLTELQQANVNISLIQKDIAKMVVNFAPPQQAATSTPATTELASRSQPTSVAASVSGPYSLLSKEYVESVSKTESLKIKDYLRNAMSESEAIATGEAAKSQYTSSIAKLNITNQDQRSQIIRLANDLVDQQVRRRIEELKTFTGQGGPINTRQSFPMTEDSVDSGAGATAVNDLQKQTEAITQSTTTAAQSTAAANTQVSETIRKNNAGLAAAVPQWGKNLSGVVTSLSLAATGVIGILGGIQQIKEGGTGNILSGIGGILTTVGSIGLSAAGMFGGGAGGGAGGGGGFGGFFSGGSSSSFNFDPGAMLGGPAFTPFAKGGVVKSPTLFQFANGGQFGVMGEAGAEAVMPLKRGPDGRLGVEQVSDGDGGSSRLREAMGRSPAQGGQASEFRIKFETTVINGVEYVSRDQLDQAMEQTRKASISEGAKRGMGMTLDKLKQSPSTRSRVGIR